MIEALRGSIGMITEAQRIAYEQDMGHVLGRTYVIEGGLDFASGLPNFTMTSDSMCSWVTATAFEPIEEGMLEVITSSDLLRADKTVRQMGKLGLHVGFIGYSDEEMATFISRHKVTLLGDNGPVVLSNKIITGQDGVDMNAWLFNGFSRQIMDFASRNPQ